jgi:cytochrome b involved in lipid metabolism
MSKSITANEVKEHATPEKGLYIIIDGGVYSMAGFVDEHPGGAKILKRVGGKGVFVFLVLSLSLISGCTGSSGFYDLKT